MRSRLRQPTGQINHGDIRGGHAERHAGELAIDCWVALAYGLCSTGRRRNDVLRRASSAAPIFTTSAGTINCQLRGRHGVNGGHEPFYDAKMLIDYLRKWRQAIGGARSV